MLSTVVAVDTEIPVRLETAKVATSVGPFGTVVGIQLLAVFQSLLPGLSCHVALAPQAFNPGIRKSATINAALNAGNRLGL